MHFGDYWPTVNHLKRTYDPKGILNPGFIDFEPEALPSP
jgi:FAD/FMN-containing dehydrogenase